MNRNSNHRATAICVATLILLPLVWLWPCVFGGKTFVPFDPAQFPPASLTLSDEELAEARSNMNRDVTEIWPWLLPEMELAQQELARGNLPQWNPHARTGTPLHEPGVLGVFYPPHWLWMAGGKPQNWLVYLTWISLALAGVFTFGLLRQVSLTRTASWFGAASFQLSGAMAANGFFFTRLPGLVWLPALLWALLRLAEGDRLRKWPFFAVAFALAMPWFSGFPPYATVATLLGGVLAVRLILERAGRGGDRVGGRLVRRLSVAMLLGVLLTMAQMLPSIWFYATEAARSANPGIEMLRSTRFDSYGLLGYLMPDAFGHPVTGNDLPYANTPMPWLLCDTYHDVGTAAESKVIPIRPNYNYTEYSVFFGTLGIVLAGFGIVRGRGHMRWFLVLVLALVLGMALYLPVVRLLYYLPAIKNVSGFRWMAPATLLLAWLAAIGFDRLKLVERGSVLRLATVTLGLGGLVWYASQLPAAWQAADPNWAANLIAERFGAPIEDALKEINGAAAQFDRFTPGMARFAAAGAEAGIWLLLCGALLAAYGLVGHPRARWWILKTLPIVTVVQLGLHGSTLLHGHRLAQDTETATHAFLRQQAEAAGDRGGFTIARARPGNFAFQLPPGQLMTPSIRDLHFYSHGDSRSVEPLRLVLPHDASRPGNPSAWLRAGYLYLPIPDPYFAHPIFDLYGVRYVLSVDELQHAGTLVDTGLKPRRGKFYVYERSNPLPRAFTVPTIRKLASDDDVLTEMAEPSTRFDQVAFCLTDQTTAPDAAPTTPPREVRFVRDEPTVVELDIAAGGQRHLVFTDAWFPGWTATIDGQPTPIGRCNHAQRLVQLPEGACTVRFQFDSPLLPYGIALSGLGLLGLLLPFVRRRGSSATTVGDETAG